MSTPQGIEDPISALFDLSDRAAAMAPVVRRLYRYTAAILAVWIVIMVVVIIVGLAAAGWLSVLALIGLAAGIIALGLLRQTDGFFREFVKRHQWIRMVQDAEPEAKIPEGRTPVERLARYLAASNPRIEHRTTSAPDSVRYRVTVHASGRDIPFDLILGEPSGRFARWIGSEEAGFVVVARVGTSAPTLSELRQLEADAEIVSAASLEGRLVRIILLRTQPVPLPEEVYDYAVGHPVNVPWGFGSHRATIEIITENPNGTYDFVPHVLAVP